MADETEPVPDRWDTIPQVVEAARRRLPAAVWDYARGGSETEVTVRRNRAAFERLAFAPRVLRDVSARDTSTSLLGTPLALPVFLAPVGSVALFDPDGALACARAAERAGIAAFVGSLSSPRLEDVGAGSTAPLYYQCYMTDDPLSTRDQLRRAEAAGYRGVCLTVDSAVYGRRERDIVSGFRPRERDKPNLRGVVRPDDAGSGDTGRARLTWDDLTWIRSATGLPLMLKGIMGAADARLAVEHGVDVVYVSNHGGRQLDHGSATLDVLPEVVDAVAGRAEVLVDGGFVRGTDVLKAVALGARVVGIGRLMTWGLAAGGVPGLVRVLELLAQEMSTAMANIGVRALGDLSREHVRAAPQPPPDPDGWGQPVA